MKGILFIGDSFTWGEGLELYSDDPTVPMELYKKRGYDYSWVSDIILPNHIKWVEKWRYGRLVANKLNTFEVIRRDNGGSLEAMKSFVYDLCEESSGCMNSNHPFDLNCFSYIIIQFTYLFRLYRFYDEKLGLIYYDDFLNACERHFSFNSTDDILYNNVTLDDVVRILGNDDKVSFINWIEFHSNIILDEFFKWCKEIQSTTTAKIKFIGTWDGLTPEYYDSHTFFNENLIPLKYNNKKYRGFFELFADYIVGDCSNLEIAGDIGITNFHPSKKCHEIVADSIVDYITADIDA